MSCICIRRYAPQTLPVASYADETVVFEGGRAFAFTEVTDRRQADGAGASDGADTLADARPYPLRRRGRRRSRGQRAQRSWLWKP